METIDYKGYKYPALQSSGNAARFCRAFADEFLKGKKVIYDIGCSKEEWKYPGSIGIDITFNNGYHAMNLPEGEIDAVHSSHFLEHYLGRWQEVIEYWLSRLKPSGIIFLYLPDCNSQKYWAFGNKKHIHYLSPQILKYYIEIELKHIVNSIIMGNDLNSSFYCVIEKL